MRGEWIKGSMGRRKDKQKRKIILFSSRVNKEKNMGGRKDKKKEIEKKKENDVVFIRGEWIKGNTRRSKNKKKKK
jgi:hypothetical protein